MTLIELSQLYWLQKEVQMDERRLLALESKSNGINGMSDGYSDRTGTTATLTVQLKGIIAEKQFMVLNERIRLEQYIASVGDSQVRQIMTYRFVDGYTWGKVAFLLGGGNTADGVRKICKRYLQRNK